MFPDMPMGSIIDIRAQQMEIQQLTPPAMEGMPLGGFGMMPSADMICNEGPCEPPMYGGTGGFPEGMMMGELSPMDPDFDGDMPGENPMLGDMYEPSELPLHMHGEGMRPYGASPYGPPPPYGASPYGPPPPYGASPYGPPLPYGASPYGPPPPYGASPYDTRPPYGASPYDTPPPYGALSPYEGADYPPPAYSAAAAPPNGYQTEADLAGYPPGMGSYNPANPSLAGIPNSELLSQLPYPPGYPPE